MAATKISALTALTTLTADDLFVVVDNPNGTPASRKITATTLLNFIQSGPFTRTWLSLPGTGLDLLGITSISGNTGYTEHGPFRFWTEIHANDASGATGYDYSFSLGMAGDGTTTNVSIITWETSYDTGGGWKTDEFYYTKQHPGGLTLWPKRRIGPCFSTFSTNRGNAANGTVVGLMNFDNVEFHATQPVVSGTSLAGWNYLNITNNYATGTTTFGLQSHSTNYGQYLLTCDSTGVAENITGNMTTNVSGDSVNLTWNGGSLAINGSTQTAAFTGTSLSLTAPGVNGSAPGMQIFHAGLYYNYQSIELRPKAANQVVGIGFWNHLTSKWSIQNRGDLSDRFAIYNVALDSIAFAIDDADNTVWFGTFTSGSDVASNGFVTIKTADGTTRKLMTTA